MFSFFFFESFNGSAAYWVLPAPKGTRPSVRGREPTGNREIGEGTRSQLFIFSITIPSAVSVLSCSLLPFEEGETDIYALMEDDAGLSVSEGMIV